MSLTWIRKVKGSGLNLVEHLLLGKRLETRKNSVLTCMTLPTIKSESHPQSLVDRSSWYILYLSPLCQTLPKAFSTSMKAAITCWGVEGGLTS